MRVGPIERHWYRRSWLSILLLPLSLLFCALSTLRRAFYRFGLFRVQHIDAPVIVVGNITVGGTGKTPLVSWLARRLTRAGFRPGIISRGYGGEATNWPLDVGAETDPQESGDEAVVLARTAGCPVIVDPQRVRGARALVTRAGCNVILSDDGLQHYALARDIEIAVVDGERRHGNGFCLPAGPLREPTGRLRQVDLVVANGRPAAGEYRMVLRPAVFRPLRHDGPDLPLAHFQGQSVHAVAGIGNPGRFFADLRHLGIEPCEHAFPDHHRFLTEELHFPDKRPVLMTEKDAVKCARLAGVSGWYLAVTVDVDEDVFSFVEQKLHKRVVKTGVARG